MFFWRKEKQETKPKKEERITREYECRDVFKPQFINGIWTLKSRCVSTYDPMNEITLTGCGEINIITEENLTSGSSAYRNNAYFGYYCQNCKRYHILRQFDIPEDVKDRVFKREHPEWKRATIIQFPKERIKR